MQINADLIEIFTFSRRGGVVDPILLKIRLDDLHILLPHFFEGGPGDFAERTEVPMR